MKASGKKTGSPNSMLFCTAFKNCIVSYSSDIKCILGQRATHAIFKLELKLSARHH